MLRTPDLFEPYNVYDKVKIAIDRIKMFEPEDGYYLAFSGGKDSQCIYHLTVDAGVKFDAHFNLTTVDPPELVWFIRKYYPEVTMHRPEMTMRQLIIKNGMPPTMIARYCCEMLKENTGIGRTVMLGVRSQESIRRKNRQIINSCVKTNKRYLNPILDWSEYDVWEYHREKQIPHCCLYDEGFNRIGCVMCPNGKTRGMEKDAKRWPKIRAAYVKTFDEMLKHKKARGLGINKKWINGEAVLNWWMAQESSEDKNQTKLSL